MRPICVVDCEFSGNGRNKDRNRIIALGACIIPANYVAQKLKDVSASTSGLNQSTTHLTSNHATSILLDPQDIPNDHKFEVYIHDDEALKQIKDIDSPGPIWLEEPDSLFWFRQDSRSRVMLQRTLSMMRGSLYDPPTATLKFEEWLRSVVKRFPDVLFVSDVSNGDMAWIDHYRQKYLNSDSINFIKSGKYESPLDLRSYFAGLSKNLGPLQFPHHKRWPFQKLCTALEITIPKINVFHDHTPLNDSLLTAFQASYLMTAVSMIAPPDENPSTLASSNSNSSNCNSNYNTEVNRHPMNQLNDLGHYSRVATFQDRYGLLVGDPLLPQQSPPSTHSAAQHQISPYQSPHKSSILINSLKARRDAEKRGWAL